MDLEPKCRRILKILQNRPDYLCEARHFPSYEIVNFSSGIGKKVREVSELSGKNLPTEDRTGRTHATEVVRADWRVRLHRWAMTGNKKSPLWRAFQ
jgi:hypothetical protein